MRACRLLRLLAVLAALPLVCAGCGASFGSVFAKQAITQNKLPAKGNSEAQILEWAGPPNERLQMSDGRERWTYIYSEASYRYPGLMLIPIVGLFFIRMDTALWKVSLVFDADGQLQEVESSHASGQTN